MKNVDLLVGLCGDVEVASWLLGSGARRFGCPPLEDVASRHARVMLQKVAASSAGVKLSSCNTRKGQGLKTLTGFKHV